MRYMRCKCGKREAWTSMGVPDCAGCPDCNTTLEESPEHHSEPAPHEWREEWTIDKQTGERSQIRVCLRCHRKEPLAQPAA